MKFQSINQKLLKSVIVVAIFLAVFSSMISFIIELDRSNKQTESMLNQLLDTVEDTAAIAAFSNNKQIAEDVLKGLLKNDIVYKARIKSVSEFNLELAKGVADNETAEIRRPLISPFDDEEILGYLIVQPEAEFKLAEAKHSAMMNALTSILIITMTSIILFMIIRSNISKPLTYVSDTLHAIEAGHQQRISELRGNKDDELGRLVSDINNLLKVLENKYNDERLLREKVETIEQELRHIFNSTSAGLFLLDANGILLTFNTTLEKCLLRTNSKIPADNTLLSSFFQKPAEFDEFIRDTVRSGQLETHDFALKRPDDSPPVWVHCLLSKVMNETGQIQIEGVLFNVTERVEAISAIAYEADHDKLTGLLRGQAAKDEFEHAMASYDDMRASFLFLDLDGFKQTNDTYGHKAGDEGLAITSGRLLACVRDTDIVCRLGGDEFLIILIDCPNEMVIQITKNIITSIQKNIAIDNGVGINIGVSIGIAHLDDNFNDFEALTQSADEAMYEVKKQGKNNYSVSERKQEA